MNLGILVLELVLFGGAGFLSWLIPKGTPDRTRTTAICFAFSVAAFIATGILSMATLNYRMPPLWIVAIAASVLVIGGLLYLIVKRVGRKVAPLLGILLLFVLGNFAFSVLAYSDAGAGVLRDRYAARAQQMGDAMGFSALMPSEMLLPVDQLPVSALPGPEQGIALVYNGFELHELRPSGSMSEAGLRKIVAAGSQPMGKSLDTIPSSAKVTTLTVNGAPAVGVQFSRASRGDAKKTETVSILVALIQGVDVRLWSGGHESYVDGRWEQRAAYTPTELGAIAATLKPAR